MKELIYFFFKNPFHSSCILDWGEKLPVMQGRMSYSPKHQEFNIAAEAI